MIRLGYACINITLGGKMRGMRLSTLRLEGRAYLQELVKEPFSQLPWERIWASWHGQRPKLHYSEQDPTKRAGAHSQYVNADSFQTFCTQVPFQDYDVMLECKAKEQALLRLREELTHSRQ